MHWSNKNWKKEDEAYFPKRKVNNKGSHRHPHLIGSFYSRTNQRVVEYESLNERLFYYYLELDSLVVRYYPQPLRVLMKTDNREWFHIPDVLVFREGSKPLLYQIKEHPNDNFLEKTKRCNEACELIAIQNEWNYSVIFPKTLPEPLPRNINFLSGFLKPRQYYNEWYQQVINRLQCIEPVSVNHLANSFLEVMDPLFIKPLIYHLIAKGVFLVNVNLLIGTESLITLNSQMESLISIKQGGMM
ncbi:hypothetical protein ACWA2B_08385 [Paenibacillus sp. CMM36]